MRLTIDPRLPGGFLRQPVPVRLSVEAGPAMHLRPVDAPEPATHCLVNVLGRPFLVHRPDIDTVVSKELAERGTWEPAESQLLLSIARPGMTVLDIGANVGYYTVLLSRVLGRKGWLFAFEPEPLNHLTLAANVLLAAKLDRDRASIHTLQVALADRAGTADLAVFPGNLGLHSLSMSSAQARPLSVTTTTIDAMRWGDGFGGIRIETPVDLIKADTQGSEGRLLRGAEQTLERDRPMLCLEFEPYLAGEAACANLLTWLAERGYQRFRLFHANQSAPEAVLPELARVLTAEMVTAEMDGRRIGPYGTLFAIHESRLSSSNS